MHFLLYLFLSLLLFFAPAVNGQAQDTTITLTNTDRDSVRQLVKQEFERWRDSVQAARIKQNVEKNGKSLDAFLIEMKEREKAEKRQLYVRIGVGVLFLTVLTLGLARWRRMK